MNKKEITGWYGGIGDAMGLYIKEEDCKKDFPDIDLEEIMEEFYGEKIKITVEVLKG